MVVQGRARFIMLFKLKLPRGSWQIGSKFVNLVVSIGAHLEQLRWFINPIWETLHGYPPSSDSKFAVDFSQTAIYTVIYNVQTFQTSLIVILLRANLSKDVNFSIGEDRCAANEPKDDSCQLST